MKNTKINLQDSGYFSDFFLDYVAQKKELKDFYEFTPDHAGFDSKLKAYTFPEHKRITLHDEFINQYHGFDMASQVSENIASIKNKETYTVTTGHQLNIFSGPLYFIYKIVTVINLSRQLKARFPNCNFIPVYWMATEDHDFEEINHFQLFGKTLSWTTSQRGAVGKFDPSGISEIFEQLAEKLPLFEKAYKEHTTLSGATRYFVNELFGKYGLLVLDGDSKNLKSGFKEIVKEELLDSSSFRLTELTTSSLENLGYKAQVKPREINLFFLGEQLRERIVKEGENFKINNTETIFTREEILSLVEDSPEKFSPNVLLRPLYEETVLPNIAYIGGPAEIIYWLQLKDLFQHFNIPFPVLVPRNFVLYINKASVKKIRKLGLETVDLFLKEELLKDKFLREASEENYKLSRQLEATEAVYADIAAKADLIDKTLVAYVMSEKQKTLKSIDDIEKRLKKAEQKKNADDIAQLTGLKGKLFPGNSLQERSDNFLNFYINDPEFIDKVMSLLDPLDFTFNIVLEEDV